MKTVKVTINVVVENDVELEDLISDIIGALEMGCGEFDCIPFNIINASGEDLIDKVEVER